MIPEQVAAILFDLDGVLWDSSAVHAAAFSDALAPLGLSATYAEIAGMRTEEAVDAVLARAGVDLPPADRAALVARKRALALAALRAAPPFAPELHRVIDTLAGRHRLALVSGASPGTVALFLELSDTAGRFEVVITGADVARGKPDPEPYRRALDALDLPGSAALVIEDAASGIASARAAGVAAIGIAGTTDPDALRAAGADDVLPALAALVPDGPHPR